MSQHEDLKTWIIVHDGPIVKNHAIEAVSFAEILRNVQRAYDNIGASKYGKEFKKEDCRLYIREIVQGSVAIPAFPPSYATKLHESSPSPFVTITESFEKIIDTLSSNPDNFQTVMEEEVANPSNRFGVLNSLKYLASSESHIELKTSKEKPQKGACVPKHQKDYLENLIFEYEGNGEMDLQGIIVGIKGDKEKYFDLITTTGRKVKCNFVPVMEEKIISLYKKWVAVSGDMIQSQKNSRISHIHELEEHTSEKLNNIGRYPLRTPIPFTASYDMEDGQWCLCNKELALFGYGITYSKTVEALEEELESHVISYTEHSDDEHAADSLIIKENLTYYVNFDEIKELIDKKYGVE
jgi:hypothetical protein